MKRFRRGLKSKAKRKSMIRSHMKLEVQNSALLRIGKNIHSYQDALKTFLPTSLTYLLGCSNSPFYISNLKKYDYKDYVPLIVPENFSIIENERITIDFLKHLVSVLFWQSCRTFRLDYSKCKYCDLATQVFLDSILKDYSSFIRRCEKSKVKGNQIGLNISSIGGNNIHEESIQRLINSVGSPVVLNNRKYQNKFVIPYKLRYYEAKESKGAQLMGQKEIDATTLIEYLDNCLSRLCKKLTADAKQALGYILGETLSNAEEHSSLHNRYLIGYFEETKQKENHYGLLNVVIMNYGKTIYEKFKNPEEGIPFNKKCQEQMKDLSDSFRSRNIFKKDEFTEETLWTLYSLQGGVSCIPPEVRKRGNGTIHFIDSFFKIKGSADADNISKMILWSGKSRIEFDGTYQIIEKNDENEGKIGIMPFNKSGMITEKPDSKYVFSTDTYFPGTMIYAKLLINDDDTI